MMGSAKQVEWANKIKVQIINEIELQRAAFSAALSASKAAEAEADVEKVMSIFDKAVAGVNKQQQASWFINNRDVTVTKKKVLEFSRL